MIPSNTLRLTCTEDRLKSNTNLTCMLQNLSARDSCIHKALKKGNETDLGYYVGSFFSLVENQDLDIAIGALGQSYVAKSWNINLESSKDGTNALYIKFQKEGKRKKPGIDYWVKLPPKFNLSTITSMGISDPLDCDHLRECTTYCDTAQQGSCESAENTSYSRVDLETLPEPKHVYEAPDSNPPSLKHSSHLTLPIKPKNALAPSCDTPSPNSNSSRSSDIGAYPCSAANRSPSHAPLTPLSGSNPYDKKEIAFKHRTETEKLQAERRKQALERSDSNHSNSDQSVSTHSYFSVLPRSEIPPKATYQQIIEQNTPTIVHSLPSEKRLPNVSGSAHIEPRPNSRPTQFQQEDDYIEMNVLEGSKASPHTVLKLSYSQESKRSSHNSERNSFGNSLMFSSKHDLSRTASDSQDECPPPLPPRAPTNTDKLNVLPLPLKGQPASPSTGKKHASISTTKHNQRKAESMSQLPPPLPQRIAKQPISFKSVGEKLEPEAHTVKAYCGINFEYNDTSGLYHAVLQNENGVIAYVLDKNNNVFYLNAIRKYIKQDDFSKIAAKYLRQSVRDCEQASPPKLPPRNSGMDANQLESLYITTNGNLRMKIKTDPDNNTPYVAKIDDEYQRGIWVDKLCHTRKFEQIEDNLWRYQSKKHGYFTYLNKFGNLFIRDSSTSLYYVYSNYNKGIVVRMPVDGDNIYNKQQ